MNEYTASNRTPRNAHMNHFTSSTGIEVRIQSQGGIYIGDDCRANADRTQALREFFRAEEDERLGRWRWPQNTDFTVIPFGDPGHVRVIDQTTGTTRAYDADDLSYNSPPNDHRRAALAFFDAHPEPKPWHAVETGEAWELTVNGDTGAFLGELTYDGAVNFRSNNQMLIEPRSSDITAGRRIYPEVSS